MNTNRNESLEANWSIWHGKLAWTATYLRKFKFGEVEFLHDFIPKYVGGSEEPASPALLLRSNRAGLEIDNMIEDVLVGDLGCAIQ